MGKINRKIVFILASTIFFSSVLRLYNLSFVPTFISDEASLGYNAYCLLKTGRDEWGRPLPLVFTAFGDYKLPVYVYLTVPSVAILGLNELAVRFPSAFFGVLTVLAIFFLARKLFTYKDPRFSYTLDPIPLLSALLLAISPWHIALSRVALEANIALFLVILGIYFLLSQRFFLTSVFFILAFYTYNSPRVFIPLFGATFLFLTRKNWWQKKREVLFGILVFFALLSPSIFSGFAESKARMAKVGIFADPGVVMRIDEKRGECVPRLPWIFCYALYNKPTSYTGEFIRNYLSHFSLDYLFLKGSSLAQYSAAAWGEFHFFELPFLLIGAYFLLVQRKPALKILVPWILFAPVANSLTGEAHPVRAILLWPTFHLIAAYGMAEGYRVLKIKKLKLAYAVIVAFIVLISLVRFFIYYQVHYPLKYVYSWQYGYKTLFPYLAREEKNYEKIIITKYYGEPHIFFLFYSKFPPRDYQEEKEVVRYEREDRWFNVDRIGRYYFRDIYYPNEKETKEKTLLVAAPQEIPEGTPIVGTIAYKDGTIAFKLVRVP
jgi:4-amino-4-deoxy-L-arabinose transferase-like glycosyltransferase